MSQNNNFAYNGRKKLATWPGIIQQLNNQSIQAHIEIEQAWRLQSLVKATDHINALASLD